VLVGFSAANTHKYDGSLLSTMAKVYYVTINGEQVKGPFDTRSEAKTVADDMNTHEVNMEYRVDGVREE
jgi:hypothetical protein